MADRMLGPYRLMDLLSSGPNGDVYLAWDTRLNQRVRLTRMPQLAPRSSTEVGDYRAFLDVMRQLSDLRHPSIASPTDFSSPVASEAWYVTDHAEGRSLRDLLTEHGRLPWRFGTMLLHEFAAALAFAHGRDIAHGQIGLGKAVIEATGRVQIVGFDVVARVLLAKTAAGAVDLASVYEELSYLSPEALQRRPPDVVSDMFSLGIVAYEMLVGSHPFASAMDILAHAQARRSPPDPGSDVGDIPLQLRRLAQSMLAPRAENRPRTAAVVRDATEQILNQAGITDIRASLRAALDAGAEASGGPGTAAQRRRTEPLLKRRAVVPQTQPSKVPAGPERRDTEPMASASTDSPTRVATQDLAARDGKSPKRSTRSMGATGRKKRKGAETLIAELQAMDAPGDDAAETSSTRVAFVLLLVFLAAGALVSWWWADSAGPSARSSRVAAAPLDPVEAGEEEEEEEELTVHVAAAPVAREGDDDERVAPAPPATDGEMHERKARRLLAGQQYDRASKEARAGLAEREDNHAELYRLLAQAREGAGDIDGAVKAWLESDEVGLRGTEGHIAAGFLLAQNQRCKDALPLFIEARDRGEETPRLLKLIGNCHLVEGQAKQAVAVLGEAYVLAGDDLDVVVPLAKAHEQLGQRDAAVAFYRVALAIDPDARPAIAGLARLAATAGDFDEVMAQLGDDVEGAPDVDPESLVLKGEAAFNAKRYGTAAKMFKRAIEAMEEPTPALLRNYAVALDRGGFAGSALRAYAAAARANPRDVDLHYLFGRALVKAKRVRDAIKPFEQVLRLEPRRADVRFDLGLALMATKRWRGAAGAFSELVKQRPGDQAAWQNLGKAQVEAGDLAGALDTFESLSKMRADDPSPVLTMAALLQRMDRRPEAAAVLQEACRRGAQEACE